MKSNVGVMKNKIAKLRKAHNMSQIDLANEVSVSRQTITSLEVGQHNASLKLAYRISRAFNITIEELFDFSDLGDEQ